VARPDRGLGDAARDRWERGCEHRKAISAVGATRARELLLTLRGQPQEGKVTVFANNLPRIASGTVPIMTASTARFAAPNRMPASSAIAPLSPRARSFSGAVASAVMPKLKAQ
jgi:hypothetical protein